MLVTNLNIDVYSDDNITKIYNSRWDIEVFFKCVKNNYKFSHLKEQTEQQYERLNTIIMIISYLEMLFENIFLKFNKPNATDPNTTYSKINKSNLIKGMSEIIYNVIKSKLSGEYIYKFCRCFIEIIYNKKNRHYERVSKIPFTKWYIKEYIGKSKYDRIIQAINDGTIEL